MTKNLDDFVHKVRVFIRDEVIPREPHPGEELDAQTHAELREKARTAGVFAPHAPKEYGGAGLPITAWPAVFIEAGYSPIGPSVLNIMAPDEGNMYMLEQIASDEQREKYLKPLAEGRVRSCFGMTEPHPGAGSDPSALRTTAHKVAGGWQINGVKRFISGAFGASFCIVMARTEATGESSGEATMFLVDMDNPGIKVGPQIQTIDRAIFGGHPYVTFEACEVPDSAVLGAVGEGFRYAQVRLGPARLTHCMRWLGLAKRSQDITLDRVQHREIFGERISDLGIAQDMLAQSAIDIETSAAIIDRTAALLESDPRRGGALSSIAKVHCSEAVWRIIDRAIQLCGGDGVSDNLPLSSYANEVRPFRIYDGSNETHKWAIARRESKRRSKEREAGAERLDLVEVSFEEQ